MVFLDRSWLGDGPLAFCYRYLFNSLCIHYSYIVLLSSQPLNTRICWTCPNSLEDSKRNAPLPDGRHIIGFCKEKRQAAPVYTCRFSKGFLENPGSVDQ
jgi:hypothetical protein